MLLAPLALHNFSFRDNLTGIRQDFHRAYHSVAWHNNRNGFVAHASQLPYARGCQARRFGCTFRVAPVESLGAPATLAAEKRRL